MFSENITKNINEKVQTDLMNFLKSLSFLLAMIFAMFMNFLGYLSFILAVVFAMVFIICMVIQQIVTYYSILEKARKFSKKSTIRDFQ